MNSGKNAKYNIDQRIDECCDKFESEIRKGIHPSLPSYLADFESEHHSQVLRELLEVEKELRDPEQLASRIETYVQQLPQFADLIRRCLKVNEALETLDATSANKKTESSPSTRRIGNYKLLQTIGEGGMGSVWMAEQEKPVRRRVALKIIKAGLDSKEVIARFEAERQALAMMDHPSIARILDAGTTDQGQPYFAMELVKGLPLTEYCDAHRLGLEQRLQLFTQVCEAVQHAHQKGIIHRDLKPSNILVAEYNGQPVPKVIDFGLAKALEATQKLTDKSLFTEFGQVLGTIKYMSPEQAGLDSLDIDTRSDIYALGVILYELLTGSTPLDSDSFKGQALLKVLELIREQESPRPSSRLSTTKKDSLTAITEKRKTDPKRLGQVLEGDLDWIVMKALDKDRNRRYETANGFAQDLQRYLNDEPVNARPPSIHYRTAKFIRKNRGLVLAVAFIATSVVMGLVGTIWFALDAGRARVDAEIRQKEAEDALSRERIVLLESVQLSEKLADVYLNSGERDLALPLFEQALERSQAILGPKSETALAQLKSVAFLYGLDGRLDEALALNEQLRDASIEVHGFEHPITQSVSNNLAATYLRVNRVSDAIPLFEQTYQLRKAQLDGDDFNLRISHRWLVIVYSISEQWEKAKPIAIDWIAQLERAGEKDSPEYAWAQTSLAAIQYGIQDFNTAETTAKSISNMLGAQAADLARADNIAACCQLRHVADDPATKQLAIQQLEESYRKLKEMLDDLPGFKQFFVVNAIKRNRDALSSIEEHSAANSWNGELVNVRQYLNGSPAPLHPGIPNFDPKTGTETPLYEKPDQ